MSWKLVVGLVFLWIMVFFVSSLAQGQYMINNGAVTSIMTKISAAPDISGTVSYTEVLGSLFSGGFLSGIMNIATWNFPFWSAQGMGSLQLIRYLLFFPFGVGIVYFIIVTVIGSFIGFLQSFIPH